MSDITWIPVESIEPALGVDPSRVTARDVGEFSGGGIPGVVYVRPLGDDRYELLTGRQIWSAAQAAGLFQVPAIICDEAPKRARPTEIARAFLALRRKYGVRSNRALAFELGVPNSTVASYLSLLRLHPDVAKLVDSGALPVTAGYRLSPLPRKRQRELAARYVRQDWSIRDLMQAISGKQRSRTVWQKSPDVLRLEEKISGALGCATRLEEGRLVIDYGGDLEVLEGVLDRLAVSLD